MKIFFASDIHGSSYYCKKMIEAYHREGAGRLFLLGDILYHGPRNDLPKEYAPKQVIAMLNPMKQEISAVRGNCDTEVDQMVLEFPILADYALLEQDGIRLYATHGHVFHEKNLLPMMAGDVLVHGHTHIYEAKRVKDQWILNPGSVSIPKGGNPPTYAVLECGVFQVKTLEGDVLLEQKLSGDR
ncbi:MAG: phosphodiesterase [Eubacteriales bacterium]|nr:phosphodiesterase [Eubacteriales bacterium]